MARPTIYSPELGERILERIADGESLRNIVKDDAMPSRSVIFLWLAQNPELSDRYARAREAQADVLADEIVSIADSDSAPDDRRVKIDARKWVAAKLRPKAYGDKVTQEHTGTIQARVTVEYVDSAARSVPLPAGAPR